MTSNMKATLQSFATVDKVDFNEFKKMNEQFPSLLYPLFRMQASMREYTLGETGWIKCLQTKANEKKNELQKKLKEEENLQKEIKKKYQKEIQKRMGYWKFLCCPCTRHKYLIEIENEEELKRNEIENQKKLLEDIENEKKLKEEMKHKKIIAESVMKIKDQKKRIPLTKEERMERAKKRRYKDMRAFPERKPV